MKKSLIMLLSCILLLAILLSACSAKISPEKQARASPSAAPKVWRIMCTLLSCR